MGRHCKPCLLAVVHGEGGKGRGEDMHGVARRKGREVGGSGREVGGPCKAVHGEGYRSVGRQCKACKASNEAPEQKPAD